MLLHWLSPVLGMPFPHPDGISSSSSMPIPTDSIFMKPSSDTPTLLRARLSQSNFYVLKGPLAGDTSCLISLMVMDLALVTKIISLPEKKPAQRKQSQDTDRLNTAGRIQILGSSHAWSSRYP